MKWNMTNSDTQNFEPGKLCPHATYPVPFHEHLPRTFFIAPMHLKLNEILYIVFIENLLPYLQCRAMCLHGYRLQKTLRSLILKPYHLTSIPYFYINLVHALAIHCWSMIFSATAVQYALSVSLRFSS